MGKSHSNCFPAVMYVSRRILTLTNWRPSSRHDDNGLGIHFDRTAVCLESLFRRVVPVCPHYTEMLCAMGLQWLGDSAPLVGRICRRATVRKCTTVPPCALEDNSSFLHSNILEEFCIFCFIKVVLFVDFPKIPNKAGSYKHLFLIKP